MRRTAQVSAAITPDTASLLVSAAKAARLTVSAYISRVLEAHFAGLPLDLTTGQNRYMTNGPGGTEKTPG